VYAFHGKLLSDLDGIPVRRRCIQRFFAPFCDAILTPSKEMQRDYSHTFGIDPHRITVIYNGVNSSIFRPATDRADSRSIFGFASSDIIIGCVARFDPVKNLTGLIKAFNLCTEEFPYLRLLLVGDGEQMEEIQSLVSNLNLDEYVTLTGLRTDIPRCLQVMDIYVQPSFYEGTSITILEAMGVGLPIIATDVGGTPEIVRDGKSGILVRAGDNIELGKALKTLVVNESKRHEMGKAGRVIVKNKFSLESMISAYEKFFLRVAGGDRV